MKSGEEAKNNGTNGLLIGINGIVKSIVDITNGKGEKTGERKREKKGGEGEGPHFRLMTH